MSADFFIDTNLLVYWRDASEPAKQSKAAIWMHWLLDSDRGALSLQVIQEYYVTVTRKLKPGMRRETARADIDDLLAWNVIWPNQAIVEKSWELEDQRDLSYWDSLILSAASVAGCKWILSEDMQSGQRIDSMQIVDPFQTSPGNVI